MTPGSQPVTARRSTLALTVVACGLSLAALPVFLVGGLAVQIRGELGFTETELGAAVTGTFLIGAALGPLGGRLSDRMGARAAILVGGILSSLALAGIALFARSWGTLAAFLGLAGVSFSFMDPGLAILITRTIPSRRHGFAFGLKEASVPAATLAAGLAVPAIALTLGWRWALLIGALPLVGLIVLLPGVDLKGSVDGPAGGPVTPPPRRAVVTVAAAAALGSTAASGIGVFLTESAVAMGMAPGSAGLLLAAGGVAGILTRLGTGLRADRRPGPQLGTIAGLMAIGAATIGLAASGNTLLLVVGTLGAFSGGWGWSGLLFLSLVRASPASPGAVAGIGLTGLAIGNAVGPLAFGAAAQGLSFEAAWAGAATLAAAGSWLMVRAKPHFDR